MTIAIPGGFTLELARHGSGWLALGLGAGFLLAILYRAERRRISPGSGILLLGLRLLAAGVLVIMLTEPVLTWVGHSSARGRVIVAVDVSESMATADPARPPEQARRLAEILRLKPAEAVESLSRREIARRLLGTPRAPLARLAEDHALEFRAFARTTSPATLTSLVELLQPQPPAETASREATDWRSVLAEGAQADRAGLAPAVALVLVTDGRSNAAEISDGDQPSEEVLGSQLKAKGIPVYSLMIGTASPPRDLAVAAIKAPESVYQGDTAPVEVTLKRDGYPGLALEVTLTRAPAGPTDKPLQLRQTLAAPDPGTAESSTPRPVVQFQVPLEQPGTVPITVAVALAGDKQPPPTDSRPDNNARTVVIQVSDDRPRVLIIEGEPRWEFRYLRNALLRDPRVQAETVVFHQPSLGPVNEPSTARESEGETNANADPSYTYGSRLPTAAQSPSPGGEAEEADPLSRFDAVVLGDVAPADLAPGFWKRLEAFVAERGGTLIVCPGPRHWPDLTSDVRSPEAARSLAALLPVRSPRPLTIDLQASDPARPGLPPGRRLVPTATALNDPTAWPMFQLRTPAPSDTLAWEMLPRLPWMLAGEPKPGATVLATAERRAGNEGEPARHPVSDPSRPAVMAAQPFGLGRVLWLGVDGTWRWRYRVGDLYHHRFWGQTVRWAAASGKLTAGNSRVRFGPLRPRINAGNTARIQARIAEGVSDLPTQPLLAARLTRSVRATSDHHGEPRQHAVLVPLRPVPGRSRIFEGDTPPLVAGSYLIRLEAPGLNQLLALDRPRPDAPELTAVLEVMAPETSERIELAASRQQLDRLAAATGGQTLTDFQADHLPDLLRSHSRTFAVPQIRRQTLWDRPVTLLAFVMILTLEWIARKRLGLP